MLRLWLNEKMCWIKLCALEESLIDYFFQSRNEKLKFRTIRRRHIRIIMITIIGGIIKLVLELNELVSAFEIHWLEHMC